MDIKWENKVVKSFSHCYNPKMMNCDASHNTCQQYWGDKDTSSAETLQPEVWSDWTSLRFDLIWFGLVQPLITTEADGFDLSHLACNSIETNGWMPGGSHWFHRATYGIPWRFSTPSIDGPKEWRGIPADYWQSEIGVRCISKIVKCKSMDRWTMSYWQYLGRLG